MENKKYRTEISEKGRAEGKWGTKISLMNASAGVSCLVRFQATAQRSLDSAEFADFLELRRQSSEYRVAKAARLHGTEDTTEKKAAMRESSRYLQMPP